MRLSATLFLVLTMTTLSAGAEDRPADFVDVAEVVPGLVVEARYAGYYNFIGEPIDGYEAEKCLLTRPAAAAIAVMLLVAATVHLPNGFFWTSGGWEYPVLWATVAGFFAIRGGGRLSLDRLIGREI